MGELNISERIDGERVVLDLSGDIIFGQSNTALRAAIRKCISEDKTNLCLNMTDVMYLDSSGIGELISALTAVNRENGKLTLRNPSDRVQTLLEISRLMDIFDLEFDAARGH